ncbi:MAG TPA: hypothetical protein VMM93_05380, partial [Vicinamibacterales bacterium]|nr:hypothetical protein [Vicinamibacterales bacterium]
MMRVRPSIPALAAVLLCAVMPIRASGPSFWTVATAADFLAGRSDGVFVSLAGTVTPGPALASRMTAPAPQVWALVADASGTLWAGTGGDGRVLRLPAGQPESVAYDANEAHVFALAVSGDRVYAATGPDGHVRVLEPDGSSRVLFDPPEKYIWALAVDGEGRVWVGAGTPATIYRVDASGTSEVIYRPPAAHVVCLAFDSAGRLLAGTESPGRLYRLGTDNRPFVLLDTGLGELRAVAESEEGALYAAAVSREGGGTAAGEPPAVTIAMGSPAAGPTPPAEAATGRSQVFRIAADGTWESVWSGTDVVYDLAPAAEGGVFVATGPEGRLYRLGPRREVSMLTGVDAGQVTRFAQSAPGGRVMAFATANPGRVLALGDRPQSPATYLSRVLDTRTVATWGLLRWEATGAVSLSTRSGNTARPDDSWSDWSAPSSAGEGVMAVSPPARFIQWRAVLETTGTGPSPVLSTVTLAYLPRNSRPVVASVTAHPPGVVFQRSFANEDGAIAGLDDMTAATRRPPGDSAPPTPSPGRRMFQRGLQTVAWKAEDADGDRLTYTLRIRRDPDAEWRELRTGLLDTIYVWDTTTVPDGRYVVRVEASDALANAAGRALVGQLDSDAITVDNTPPAISATVTREATGALIVIEVRDALSPIQKVEYSVAGGAWQLLYPVDGLADSPVERYQFRLDAARRLDE